jgi:hypothetical protein
LDGDMLPFKLRITLIRLIPFAACATLACTGQDRDQETAERAEKLWHASAPNEYVFVYQRLPPEQPIAVRVAVADGRAVDATDATGALAIGDATTIDDLFVEVDHWLDQHPISFKLDSDPHWGYPRLAQADFSKAEDDVIGFSVTCFVVKGGDDACPNGRVNNDTRAPQ